MPSSLALSLSPRPPRTVTRDECPFIFADGAASAEFSRREDGTEVFHATHDTTKAGCQGGFASSCTPPTHFHSKQSEHYKVITGQYGMIVDGAYVELKAGDPEYVVKPRSSHTFWPSKAGGEGGECKIEIWAGGVGKGELCWDEEYFRNSQSYYRDLKKAGLPYSKWAMLPLTVPRGIFLPSEGIPTFVMIILSWLATFYAEYILGYERSYPEYSKESKKTI